MTEWLDTSSMAALVTGVLTISAVVATRIVDRWTQRQTARDESRATQRVEIVEAYARWFGAFEAVMQTHRKYFDLVNYSFEHGAVSSEKMRIARSACLPCERDLQLASWRVRVLERDREQDAAVGQLTQRFDVEDVDLADASLRHEYAFSMRKRESELRKIVDGVLERMRKLHVDS